MVRVRPVTGRYLAGVNWCNSSEHLALNKFVLGSLGSLFSGDFSAEKTFSFCWTSFWSLINPQVCGERPEELAWSQQ